MALELARHIECLGGVKEHKLLLLNPSNVSAVEILAVLENSFGWLKHITYPPRLNGWPDGPNQCYSVAAQEVMKIAGDEPWLWLEADCVPMYPRWLDDIQHEHRYCGMPILGALEPTFALDGNAVSKHVTGVAVYPHDWWKKCPVLRSLVTTTETYRTQGGLPPAFDVYIAPYSVPLCGFGSTMRHYWKSHTYRQVGGEVLCRFQSPYGASPTVDMNAALIHGCKDYTLLDIVQGRLLKSA
jgi:hypothetical protein